MNEEKIHSNSTLTILIDRIIDVTDDIMQVLDSLDKNQKILDSRLTELEGKTDDQSTSS